MASEKLCLAASVLDQDGDSEPEQPVTDLGDVLSSHRGDVVELDSGQLVEEGQGSEVAAGAYQVRVG